MSNGLWSSIRNYSGNPWLKWVLIPFWFLQFGATLGTIVWLAVAGAYGYFEESGGYHKGEAASIVPDVIALALLIMQMTFYGKHRLSPVLMMVSQIVMTLWWTVWFVILWTRIPVEFLILIFAIFTLSFSLISLIYCSIVFHRHRRAGLKAPYIEMGSLEALREPAAGK